MSSTEDIIRLKSIQKKLNAISIIVDRHNGIVKTLEDEIEAQPAILMQLVAIAEQVNKLQKEKSKVLDNFNQNDIKGIFSIRNFIAHDYDGIRLAIIEDVIRYKLPPFLEIVNKILEEYR